METFKIVVLALSGLALIYASSMRLFNPSKAPFLQTYLKHPQNSLKSDVSLINEIRGIGAVMLLGGILTIIGTLKPEFRLISFVLAAVIFLGVSLGRSLSFFMDGNPDVGLIRVAFIEIILAVLNIFCLLDNLI